jgi:hypothetical protein
VAVGQQSDKFEISGLGRQRPNDPCGITSRTFDRWSLCAKTRKKLQVGAETVSGMQEARSRLVDELKMGKKRQSGN